MVAGCIAPGYRSLLIDFFAKLRNFTNNLVVIEMPEAKAKKHHKLNKKQKDGLKKGQSRMKRAAAEYRAGKYKSMQDALKHVK